MEFFMLIIAGCLALAEANLIPQTRIIGGIDARAGQYSYVASIQTAQNEQICGAAIISSRWVVSAASCTIGLAPGVFTVRTGTHIFNQGGVQHQVARLENHPNFVYSSRKNDISLVQTATAIANNAYSRPIAVSRLRIGSNTAAVIVGWGRTDANSPNKSAVLKVLNTNIIANEQCRTGLSAMSFQKFVQDSNICTLTRVGEGLCRADSGSPLTVGNELVGIASFGVSCALGLPDVYTRVHMFADWIIRTAV